ncbi:MAG TPA: phosphotransferase family protein [Acidimicrobiales bacterium]|nr:phosphotransferase family protein [Acidimicrobiales bacterium]
MAVAAEEIASRLGDVLDGKVSDLRRLSGGASRTTSSFDLRGPDGTTRSLILQQGRGSLPGQGQRAHVEAALLTAARAAGVPVPGVVAAGVPDGLPAGWLVVERLDGESIPRKILRDPEWSEARARLAAQCGRALAAIHGIDPAAIEGLPPRDPFDDPCSFLDALGEVRPALELGVRWLEVNRPPPRPPTTVHGDFRTGNFLIGRDGLGAVLDWELAHIGEAAEDVGWLCAPAWRFGGRGRVGGFGDLATLLQAYAAAGGEQLDERRVHWWEVYATVKWAVICALQASAHLSGRTRSIELVAIGRRVCESEWDLFTLIGVVPAHDEPPPEITRASPAPLAPFGRPTLEELVEALGEHLEGLTSEQTDRGSRFEARIAANVAGMVDRQLGLAPAVAAAHARRLARLGFDDDAALVAAIRRGTFDDQWGELGAPLAASARDQLLVANPSYLA